jgi:hypothetical protein
LLIASFLLVQDLLPIKIIQMLLPARCARRQTARSRASGVVRLHKIFLTIQVEWRVVKLFDITYNAITLYHLEAFLAVFRIIPGHFSAARRFCKPFVSFALSSAAVATLLSPTATNYYVHRPALRGASLPGAAPWLVLTSSV